MKITKKFTLAGLSSACALSFAFGVGMLATTNGIAKAEDSNAPDATVYFYDNLVDADGNEYTLAKKFYSVLDEMNKNGDFVDGVVDYNISDIVTSDQLKGWVEDGNLDVPKAFSAARDTYLTDHPELFYINFYKMTISVAKSGGNYVGYINSGREANLYYDNGFNTQTKVEEAITAFETSINEVVDYVTNLEETENTYNERDFYLAKAVNTYLAENIKYDYAAYEGKDDPNYVAAAYINTPYGGLVERKAVCGGFSTAYKVVMDKLGIPCITVNGYSKNKDEYGLNSGSGVYHMWNYVYLKAPSTVAAQSKSRAVSDGAWYSVDVTWDSASYVRTKYAVMNAYVDADYHGNDGVISSSGYELKYPELSAFNYGSTGETDGLVSSMVYNPAGEKDDYGNDLKDDYGNPLQETYSTVSYNGKSAKRLLEEDGLYLVARFADYDTETASVSWEPWFALAPFIDFAELGIGEGLIRDTGVETSYYGNTSIYYTQYAVFDIAPDVHNPVTSESGNFDFYYSDNAVNDSKPVETGKMLVNESYGTYKAPPHILDSNPSQQSIILISDAMGESGSSFVPESKAITIEITYDQPLHILKSGEPIGITFVSQHPNAHDYAKFYPINSNGDLVELVEGTIDSKTGEKALNTLRFKFAPSLMYEHDAEGYHFLFTNVGSAVEMPVFGNGVGNDPTDIKTSDKQPMAPFYCFARPAGVCPKRFNYDGRLYIECCAQPTFISNSDLSDMEFVDENGDTIFSDDSRSQLMLVAEKADVTTEKAILDGINESDEININSEDIRSSETYEITLSLCAKFAKIKDGSYIKMALGFPEGYGPDDVGVTFKLYHRKHIQGDEYIIEEIPCVVTKYGIVATVTSFSPYMVVAVDADKATDKTVYASIEGNGGTLTNEDGRIISFKEGDTHTYTIQPDAGYLVYSITLNGKSVLDKLVDGKLTLGYDDLEGNNELVIQYIANEAAARIQQKLDNNDIDEALEVGKCVITVDGKVTANTSMPGYTVDTDSFVYIAPVVPDNGDNDNNGGDDEANVPGPSTGIDGDNGGSNTTAIVISVVCVVVALGAAGAVVAILLRKKKNQ